MDGTAQIVADRTAADSQSKTTQSEQEAEKAHERAWRRRSASPSADGQAVVIDLDAAAVDPDAASALRLDLLRTIATPQVASGRLAFEARLVQRAQRQSIRASVVQRAFDVVVASIGIVLTAPVFALVAIMIRLTSRGPVIFRQVRVGQRGRPFTCLKFRTMRVDAAERLAAILLADESARVAFETTFKLDDDPRITRIGRFLRRTSLDELPQLFNVLRGEMGIVGPRPVVPEELGRYGDFAQVVLQVRPGMTGSWQVNGRSSTTYIERIRLDVAYVLDRSLLGDIDIVRRTIRCVLDPEPDTSR